jgi:hypothetical protein
MTEAAKTSAERFGMVAAVAMFLAGALHLAIFWEHWSHAPAHGLFFVVAGASQIVWALAYWRSQSSWLARAGFVLSLTLIIFWTLTRIVRAPFGHEPEGVDLAGVVTKACETICVVALAVTMTSASLAQPGALVRRLVVVLVVISFAFAGITYSVAIAAEPLFPALAPVEDEHHIESHEEQHEESHGDQNEQSPDEEHEEEHDGEHEESPEAGPDEHSSLPVFRRDGSFSIT